MRRHYSDNRKNILRMRMTMDPDFITPTEARHFLLTGTFQPVEFNDRGGILAIEHVPTGCVLRVGDGVAPIWQG